MPNNEQTNINDIKSDQNIGTPLSAQNYTNHKPWLRCGVKAESVILV